MTSCYYPMLGAEAGSTVLSIRRPMMHGARDTVRNAAQMLVQRGAQTVGGLGFALLVPRLMGPEQYGRYALATSVAFWLALVSGLGLVNATTRYVPGLLARGDTSTLRRLIGNLFTLRVASGLLAALLYLGVGLVWWRDLDPMVAMIMAIAVWVQGISNFLFSLFVGFNQAGRWALGDTVRRWLLLVLVIPGYYLDGLRGAAAGVLLTELAALGLGLAWTSLPRTRRELWPDVRFLAPYLRFGVAFLVTQVLFIAFLGSGEVLVRAFSGRYVEVGYFSVAHGAYLVLATTLPQLMLVFVPLLSGLLETGRPDDLARWSERLARVLAATGVLVIFGTVFVAEPYVPLVFGAAFEPVVGNLLPLAGALLAITLGSVPSLLALVHERPVAPMAAAALRLVVFWSIAPSLISRAGSRGACLAVFVASVVHALYLIWRLRALSGRTLRAWVIPVALGAPLLLLAWLRTGGPFDALLFVGVALAYACALLLLGVVTREELSAIWSFLRRPPKAPGRGGAR